MSRTARLVMMLVGFILAGIFVWQSGPRALLEGLRASWWVALPLIPLWGAIYVGNAIAWKLITSDGEHSLPLRRAVVITIAGFALNYATPVVTFGGEPVKIAMSTPWLGSSRAMGSVIGYRLLHTLSHLLVNLVALVPAFFLFPRTPLVWAGLVALGLALTAVTWFLIGRHRDGLLVELLALGARLPLIGVLVRRFRPTPERLREIDAHLTAVYRERPPQFRRAVFWEMASRALTMGEYTLIIWGMGAGFHPMVGLVIGAFSSLFVNVMAFIPYELGTREAGLYGLFQFLGFDAALGVQAALLTRVREIAWMGIGLLLLAHPGDSVPPARAAS